MGTNLPQPQLAEDEMGKSRQVDRTLVIGWRVAQALTPQDSCTPLASSGTPPYRIGHRGLPDGRPRLARRDHLLYAGDVTFPTRIGPDLPFIYPPLVRSCSARSPGCRSRPRA